MTVERPQGPAPETPEGVRDGDVAIVGMACRFPGARSVDEFWSNLREGVESIRTLSDEDLRRADAPASLREDPDHVPREGVLEDVDAFDADFFGMSPRDAAIMDPQHRHFLECAWEALEDAAHPPDGFDGPVGVFAGSGMQTYLIHNLLTNRSLMDTSGLFLVRHTGNDKDFLATRASYEFDLRGPGVNVQTACSTSLVAVHLACESLLGRECDMALAGGVTIEVPHGQGYLYREGAIFSADGRCRAFDADAGGTVGGSGVGVVVLRRLEDALADGDHVHAVIRGSAVNNDGAGKVGFLAPSVDGQAEAVAEALAVADVPPGTVDYVEAHGTATPLGDPIEMEGLTRAFRLGTEARRFCGLGSVKTNVGHLDAAAGVAGLIKTALALEHGELPPSLHFREPNPEIDFEDSPFYVVEDLRPWERNESPRRAGVNSLGVGGTNAHVVLQEAPREEPDAGARSHQLLTISARTPEALERATDRLASHLERHPRLSLPDVAFTLQEGRRRFRCRRTLVCRSTEEAAETLRRRNGRSLATRSDRASERSVVWMFPGQGAQYPGMGRELYEEEEPFRRAVDRCARILEPELGLDVREALFPARAGEAADDRLRHTSVTQPAVFTVEYALAELWSSFGVEPAAMIGHSLGELVAACRAGVFALEDALGIVAARGRLMGRLPAGSMLAVPLPEERLRDLLDGETSLAVVNAPDLCVASGPDEAVDRLQARLEDDGLTGRRLHTSHAFHSPMMDPAVEAFEEELRAVDLEPPSVPVVSNVTGDWMAAGEATDPAYWARHIRETVRFSDGLERILADTDAALLEVGPGTTLTSLARRHPGRERERPLEASLPHPDDDVPEEEFLLAAVGGLWRAGASVDWPGVHAGARRRRLRLPTYPFERERYWIEPGDVGRSDRETDGLLPGTDRRRGDADELPRREDMEAWLHRPAWRPSPRPGPDEAPEPEAGGVLVLRDGRGVGDAVADRLEERGLRVVRVTAGPGFEEAAPGAFVLDPSEPEGYGRLLRRLDELGVAPDRVVHCWSLASTAARDGLARREEEEGEAPAGPELEDRLRRSFFSLLHLARALGEVDGEGSREVTVVSDGAQAAGGPPADPVAATLAGPARVMDRELPDVSCRWVDVSLDGNDGWRRERVVDQLVAEILSGAPDPMVAYRGPDRLVREFEPAEPALGPEGRSRLREEGIYLVTGGLGALGRVLAEHLAETRRARLALVSRSGLPPRESWDAWLADHGGDDATSRRIRTVRRIEEAGGQARVIEADVTDPAAVREAVAATREAFGAVHGAFHLAGRLDDGLIRLKDPERAAAVLAPKVRGTIALDEALRDVVEDFVVLFSSLSAVAGPVGQVDYAAANAFMDAFAGWRSRRGDTPVISVGWGTWRAMGMSADAAADDERQGGASAEAPATAPDGAPADGHPLLERRATGPGDREEFVGRLDPSRHWILDEHRARDGTPVLPGTGYLELARAAVGPNGAGNGSGGILELRDVLFVAPWTAENEDGGEIRVTVRRDGDRSEFAVRSPAGDGRRSSDGTWIEHARGTARIASGGGGERLPLAEIRERCGREEVVLDGAPLHEQLRLGPRWGNIRRIHAGEDEALVELRLPDAFHGELEEYPLHPAILDSALGAGQVLVPESGSEKGFFFPAALDAVRAHAPLAPEMVSHVRRRATAGTEDAVFDVTVADPDGAVLLEAEGFRMRRAAGEGVLGAGSRAEARRPDPARDVFEVSRRKGILPDEGMAVLERILSGYPLPHVVVSPLELDALLRKVGEAGLPGSGDAAPSGGADADHGRPGDLSTSYREPRTELEETIATTWREHLGIGEIGVHDDFFELGGHSLVLSQIASRLQKKVGREVHLSRLFEDPTVAGWAEILEGAGGDAGDGSMTSVSRVSREEVRVDLS